MTNDNSTLSALFLASNNNDICTKLYSIFGEPVDSYWNGSNTWFDEPSDFVDISIEWRLHPISGFEMPKACRPEELFTLMVENKVDLTHYIEGLEVFPTDENDISIEKFSDYIFQKIGLEPDYIGYVDHDIIGNQFEQSNGDTSIIQCLKEQLLKL
jgi:hypothetical protein